MFMDETVAPRLLDNIRGALKPIEAGDSHSSIIKDIKLIIHGQEVNFNPTGTTHMIMYDKDRDVYELGYIYDSDIKKQLIASPLVYAEFNATLFTDFENLADVITVTYIRAIIEMCGRLAELYLR